MTKTIFLLSILSLGGIFHLDKHTISIGGDQAPEKKEFDLGSGVTITMIWVEPGSFLMGSPDDEPERKTEREKQHKVRFTKGFWLAEKEFTQADWKKIMKENLSQNPGDDFPVDNVSYEDVIRFLAKVNTSGSQFRLPTEAEWEYACRAGTIGPYDGELEATTWHIGNSGRVSHPVATKQPNPWGFYDMHGNILEWCSDWFQEDYSKDTLNPKGPDSGIYRVQRGGQFTGRTRHTRAADRQRSEPNKRAFYVGFRLASD